MLVADFEELDEELKEIDEKVKDVAETPIVDSCEGDEAAYQIPESDEGYQKILKERFGHDSFKEG